MFALSLLTAPAAVAADGSGQPPGDVNCEDVTYQEAQDILAADPSDPNGLDRDGDGEACDSKAPEGGTDEPTIEPTPKPTEPESPQPSADVNCEDVTYQEAQEILAADPSDPNRLDRDRDGVACETNAGGGATDADQDNDKATDEGLAPAPAPAPAHIAVTG